ncbi:nuclear transport factor 2 family protein [Mycobacterium sp. 3519A]|uniref:nuclear transport factor 2 family protein n=1 Tax=Mycobacterium sp. 3519A TaxID=2057184 RepID=UPI000C7A4188|nr:nuclear transport factor 2 family protein [Mycobacterium sp. 3519A]
MGVSQIAHTPRISWNATTSEHPARVASWRALDAITRGDKSGYVSLYAPDGVIHDPIGKTAIDPTGSGHRGADALEKFWDQNIATAGALSFVVHTSLACDNHVANSFTINIEGPDGAVALMDCIFVYQVDELGLLVHVAGYWEPPTMDELPSVS